MIFLYFIKLYSIDSDTESWSESDFSTQRALSSLVWFYKKGIFKRLTISDLPLSYTTSPDDIPAYLIKKVAVALTVSREHIFNFSYMHSTIPKRWKHEFVTTISSKSLHNMYSI